MSLRAAGSEAELTPLQAATLAAARALVARRVEPTLAAVEAVTGRGAQYPRARLIALGLWPVEAGAGAPGMRRGPRPGARYKDHARRVRAARGRGSPERLELIRRTWEAMHGRDA